MHRGNGKLQVSDSALRVLFGYAILGKFILRSIRHKVEFTTNTGILRIVIGLSREPVIKIHR